MSARCIQARVHTCDVCVFWCMYVYYNVCVFLCIYMSSTPTRWSSSWYIQYDIYDYVICICVCLLRLPAGRVLDDPFDALLPRACHLHARMYWCMMQTCACYLCCYMFVFPMYNTRWCIAPVNDICILSYIYCNVRLCYPRTAPRRCNLAPPWSGRTPRSSSSHDGSSSLQGRTYV